jgi:Fe-S-cluster containining protein
MTMNLLMPRCSITPIRSSVCESHGRSISSGPEDSPGPQLEVYCRGLSASLDHFEGQP